MKRLVFLAGAALAITGCGDYSEPGSFQRKALETLDRSEVHCVGRRRISCHTHWDGVPPASVYRPSYRRR